MNDAFKHLSDRSGGIAHGGGYDNDRVCREVLERGVGEPAVVGPARLSQRAASSARPHPGPTESVRT
ncbi:hypothetical protein [Streptomyces sp. KMM 9044]|uniref:hypothetical protein n=1 Tax=Streptomyces sp. KMM 9044 TaxID=2744474 RepID=UPI002151B2BC|nr:hypothetical protein [Streptomyces sp. KMM 9044]WAX76628.1 hypothetical protein HUV60_001975 [Streptomyces sp. KMM 9044]